MTNIELLSIGDATMDAFVVPSETEALCTIDNKECLICFSYGDKIPAKSLEFSVGGNAANLAVGSRRLGVKSGIVLTLGDDRIGREIAEKLETEQVDTSFVVQQPATVSNFNTVINYAGERTILTFKAPRSYEFPTQLPPKIPWVYLTSMGESFVPFYNHLADWLITNPDVKLGFNPGSRQIRADVESLAKIMKLTYIIFVNKQEAEKLTGNQPNSKEMKDLLKDLSAKGPKISVITNGNDGSYVFDGQKFYHAEILPVDAHERTGAGDAFGTGCLSAIIKGKSFEEALLWGTLNSASVIGFTGPQKGLIKESEMSVWLDRAKSSGVKTGEF